MSDQTTAVLGYEFNQPMGTLIDPEFHPGSAVITVGGRTYDVIRTSKNTYLIPCDGSRRDILHLYEMRSSTVYSNATFKQFQKSLKPLRDRGAYLATAQAPLK